MPRPSAEPSRYDRSVEWFRARVPMTDAEFAALAGAAEDQAFWVAGAAELDLVDEVYTGVADALAQGTSLEDFKAAVAEDLYGAWGEPNANRVETIFRVWVQRSYQAGRYTEQTDEDVTQALPYLRYSAVLDSRTTEICQELDGTILRADDPYWQTHWPPNHFNCRSTLVSLSDEEAQADGISDTGPPVVPDDGFGVPSGDAPDWTPDLAGYSPGLAGEVSDAAAEG